jgi:cytochrome c peroxidase
VNIMAESQLGSPLSNEETAQLVAFLESLTGTLADTTPPVLP